MSQTVKGKKLLLAILICGCMGMLHADTYNPISGAIDLDVFSSGQIDINGNAAFLDTNLPSDAVIALDLNFLVHPGNTLLIAYAFNDPSQLATMAFDPSGAAFSGADLTMPGFFSAIQSPDCAGGFFAGCQPVTDAALSGLLGLVQFDFAFAGSTPGEAIFQLQSITTPEPGTVTVFLIGVLGTLQGLRLKRRRRAH